MAGVKFTKAQSDAINVNCGSILVSAGAGSGKTAVLTQRVIEKITNKEDYTPADSMLISTFTKSASAEMKQRIEEKLEQLISENPEDEFLKRQQLLLSNAQISTIHSLCQSLIKENYHKLNLASGYRVADEKEIKILKDKVLDEILEQNYLNDDEDFTNLANMFSSKDDSALKELFNNIYMFIVSYPYPLNTLEEITNGYIDIKPLEQTKWYKVIFEMIKIYTSELEKIALKISEFANINEQDLSPKLCENIKLECSDIFMFAQKLKEKDIMLSKIKEIIPKKNRVTRRKPKDYEIAEIREKAFVLINEIITILDFNEIDYQKDMEYLSSRVKVIKRIVEDVYITIQKEKKEISVIDYNDMEHFAIQLLVEYKDGKYIKTDLAKSLSDQYSEIMVDECQDLNLSQNIIFWALSKSSDEVSADMDTNELLADSQNLFMVGDVKQSIYRFRGAKPKLFVKRKDIYSDYDKDTHNETSLAKITLKDNFRSRKEVINSVNAIFENIMTRNVGDIDYDESEKLIPSGSFKDTKGDKTTEVHLIKTNNCEDKGTEVEAKYVAKLIQKMVDDGFEIDDKGTVRKCTYKDFCILLRTAKGKVEIFSEKLKELGIDSYIAKTQGYLERYEVAVMLDLLRVIDNPLIDTALLSIMMSQMFGFTDDEIANIRIKNTNQPLYLNLLDEQKAGDFKVSNLLATLEYLREKAITNTTDKLIQIIFDKTDFLLMMSAMPNGEQRKANLRLLTTLAQEYEAFGSYGLSGFIRYVDKAAQTNHDFESANAISEKANVVKIVTIHNSKGLEYPICILADTNKKFNDLDSKGDYVLDETLGLGIKTIMNEHHKKYNNITNKASRLSIQKDSASEEMRILYVALTRAREKLIITANFEQSAKKDLEETLGINLLPEMCSRYIEWLLIAGKDSTQLKQELDLKTIGSVTDFPVKYKLITDFKDNCDEQSSDNKLDYEQNFNEKTVENIKEKFNFVYKRKEVTQIPAKVTVTQIAKSKQDNKIFSLPKMKIEKQEKLTGAQKGDILHKFMQYVNFENAKNNLESELNRLKENEFLTQTEIENINQKNVNMFLNSDLMQRMLNSQKLHREYQFIYQIDAKEVNEEISDEFAKEKVLIQGIADLIIEEADGIIIVDYKTDYLNNEQDFIDRYQKQLEIYKDAMNKYFDKPVKECVIYSLHMGKAIIL